jgi:phospholipase/carboxylesterase
MTQISPLISDLTSGLGYRICEPAPQSPSSLLVLLHGVGGNETNLAELAGAAPANTLVVLVRGRLALAPGAYAWFRVAFGATGPRIEPEEAEQSRLALIELVDQLQARYGVAPARTIIAGFSQGGILSASVGLSAPEGVAGFAVLAGRILPELEPVIAARDRLVAVRALIAHGRNDDKLTVNWADKAHAWLDRLGVTHELKLYPGGHGISDDMANDFLLWMRSLLTAPVPADRLELHLDDEASRLSSSSP